MATGPALIPSTRLVLVAMAYHATADGRAYPSLPALAATIGVLSVRSLHRCSQQLHAAGLLEVTKRPGSGRHNAYRLAGGLTGWVPQPFLRNLEHDAHDTFHLYEPVREPEGLIDRQSIHQSNLVPEHDTGVTFEPDAGDMLGAILAARVVRGHWAEIQRIRPWRSIKPAIAAYTRDPEQFADLLAELHLKPDGSPAPEPPERENGLRTISARDWIARNRPSPERRRRRRPKNCLPGSGPSGRRPSEERARSSRRRKRESIDPARAVGVGHRLRAQDD